MDQQTLVFWYSKYFIFFLLYKVNFLLLKQPPHQSESNGRASLLCHILLRHRMHWIFVLLGTITIDVHFAISPRCNRHRYLLRMLPTELPNRSSEGSCKIKVLCCKNQYVQPKFLFNISSLQPPPAMRSVCAPSCHTLPVSIARTTSRCAPR